MIFWITGIVIAFILGFIFAPTEKVEPLICTHDIHYCHGDSFATIENERLQYENRNLRIENENLNRILRNERLYGTNYPSWYGVDCGYPTHADSYKYTPVFDSRGDIRYFNTERVPYVETKIDSLEQRVDSLETCVIDMASKELLKNIKFTFTATDEQKTKTEESKSTKEDSSKKGSKTK